MDMEVAKQVTVTLIMTDDEYRIMQKIFKHYIETQGLNMLPAGTETPELCLYNDLYTCDIE